MAAPKSGAKNNNVPRNELPNKVKLNAVSSVTVKNNKQPQYKANHIQTSAIRQRIAGLTPAIFLRT